MNLFEARVGKPTVSSECCFRMVMVMFYIYLWNMDHSHFSFLNQHCTIEQLFLLPDGETDFPAEQENGVQVLALPAL